MSTAPEYSVAEHQAWLDALPPDDRATVIVPDGHKFNLFLIALTKRALLTDDISPAEKLELLERLHGLADGDLFFSREMIALIQPMGDSEFQIYRAAASLDDGLNRRPKG